MSSPQVPIKASIAVIDVGGLQSLAAAGADIVPIGFTAPRESVPRNL